MILDLEPLVSLTNDWIVSRTGIEERRAADESEATSDLAYQAALEAVNQAGMTPTDIDMILVATETPDHILPPVACQIQHRLGCRHVGAGYSFHLCWTRGPASFRRIRSWHGLGWSIGSILSRWQ
jgi:3-oxoacyl-[acyl-carrier-protein] synthase III